MTIKTLVSLFGKSGTDPEFARALAGLGFEKRLLPLDRKDKRIQPSPPFGFYLIFKKTHGLDMRFKYAETLPAHCRKSYPEGAPILTSAFLYPIEKPYFVDLPGNITFSDSREIVRQKLGVPTQIFIGNKYELWVRSDVRINIEYNDQDKINNINLTTEELFQASLPPESK
jgi:hypothetical protein